VVEGPLRDVATHRDAVFGLHIPNRVPDVPTEILDPRGAWPDANEYDRQAVRLRAMFDDNYANVGKGGSAAG
jgi:phosphoenolpyruvate carboxykinase (ATP)